MEPKLHQNSKPVPVAVVLIAFLVAFLLCVAVLPFIYTAWLMG